MDFTVYIYCSLDCFFRSFLIARMNTLEISVSGVTNVGNQLRIYHFLDWLAGHSLSSHMNMPRIPVTLGWLPYNAPISWSASETCTLVTNHWWFLALHSIQLITVWLQLYFLQKHTALGSYSIILPALRLSWTILSRILYTNITSLRIVFVK